jgi:hypothetical protein
MSQPRSHGTPFPAACWRTFKEILLLQMFFNSTAHGQSSSSQRGFWIKDGNCSHLASLHSHAFWCPCGCLSPLSPQLRRGLAMLRYFDPAFMDAVANSMCKQLRSFEDVQIGNVLFAFATFGYSGPPDFLPTVAKEVGRTDPCAGMCPPFTLSGRQCAPSCSAYNPPTLVKSWKVRITVANSQKHFSRPTNRSHTRWG